jgi:hypothetical protein
MGWRAAVATIRMHEHMILSWAKPSVAADLTSPAGGMRGCPAGGPLPLILVDHLE